MTTPSIHFYPLTILEGHLDSFGHVNNAVYLSILEEARWDLITQNGYGLKEIQTTGLAPVILEIQIRFLRELKLREKVVIETQLKSYENRIALIYQEIKSNEGKIHCIAEFKVGLFSVKDRKLVKSTPAWLKALGVPETPES